MTEVGTSSLHERPITTRSDGTGQSLRLVSLDVFRGVVILAMLIVNNLGDSQTTGYFWKHADWPEPWLAESFRMWWSGLKSGALPLHAVFTQFPLFKHCTLADYVMPWFMLIIGLAIPWSAASAQVRGIPRRQVWLRVIKRSAMLVALGWILCYFRDQFATWLYTPGATFKVVLGMDVLQLLGVAYLVARVAYKLPMYPRLALAAAMFLWHWMILRFLPQGDVTAGTFTHEHNAIGYIYSHVGVWSASLLQGRFTLSLVGLLSVPPAAATMLIGTVVGDYLRRNRESTRLLRWGFVLIVIGALWALDLPFNKPRWTPAYLLWTSGVGVLLIALLRQMFDGSSNRARVAYPFVVLGSNPLAAYFITILAKVLLLNTPRVTYAGEKMSLNSAILLQIKSHLGAHAGGWAYTIAFVLFWWLVLAELYRRKIVWKV
jgi:predicted acyltransferase